MVGLSGEIVAHIVLRVNATSGVSETTTTTKMRKQARPCSTFFAGFLDVIAQLMLPNLIEMAMRSPLHQEYPTEPLDKIPARQVEFELAGKKKTLAS